MPADPPLTCPNCDYELRGLPARGGCPECGYRYDMQRGTPGEGPRRTDRRRTLNRIDIVASAVLATLLVVLLIFLVLVFPPG